MFEIESSTIEDFSDRKDYLTFLSEAIKDEVSTIKKNNAINHENVLKQNEILKKYEAKR